MQNFIELAQLESVEKSGELKRLENKNKKKNKNKKHFYTKICHFQSPTEFEPNRIFRYGKRHRILEGM